MVENQHSVCMVGFIDVAQMDKGVPVTSKELPVASPQMPHKLIFIRYPHDLKQIVAAMIKSNPHTINRKVYVKLEIICG